MKQVIWFFFKVTAVWGIWQLMWEYTLIWKAINHNFSWSEVLGLILIFNGIRAKYPEKKI